MGYSTTYTLKWEATAAWRAPALCEHVSQPGASFCSTCGRPTGVRALDDVVAAHIAASEEMSYVLEKDGRSSESGKWYEAEEDLKAMSLEIRGVIFHLAGEGEEPGDLWDAFALDGQVEKHKAKIVRATVPAEWRKS